MTTGSSLLCIETSTAVCSAAIVKDGHCIALREHSEGMAHAEKLTVYIQELLQETGLKVDELSAVAVSGGPGSYTGLRIGVSTAKGLCWAADKPLIAIPTLQSMTFGVLSQSDASAFPGEARFCPMLDARRMEVYTALFDVHGRLVEAVTAKVVEQASFDQWLDQGPVWFFGDGMPKCKEVLSIHPNAKFAEQYRISAKDLAAPAIAAFDSGSFEEVGLYEPFYFKEFVAGKGSAVPVSK